MILAGILFFTQRYQNPLPTPTLTAPTSKASASDSNNLVFTGSLNGGVVSGIRRNGNGNVLILLTPILSSL